MQSFYKLDFSQIPLLKKKMKDPEPDPGRDPEF